MEIASILPSSPAWWLVTMLPAINGHHISHAHVTLHDQNNPAHLHLHSYRHPTLYWMPILCHVLHLHFYKTIFKPKYFYGVCRYFSVSWTDCPLCLCCCVACRGMVRAATRITRELSGGYFYILAGCSSCSSTAGQAAINWPDTGHQPSHSFPARAGHNQCQYRGLLWKHDVILCLELYIISTFDSVNVNIQDSR